jgi:hypothetical protein
MPKICITDAGTPARSRNHTRMTEKHYAHLAPSYVADTIRAHFPTLGIAEESTVILIRTKSRLRRG